MTPSMRVPASSRVPPTGRTPAASLDPTDRPLFARLLMAALTAATPEFSPPDGLLRADQRELIALDAFPREAWLGAEPTMGGLMIPMAGLILPNVLGRTGTVTTTEASLSGFLSALPFVSLLRSALGPLAYSTALTSQTDVASFPQATGGASASAMLENPGSPASPTNLTTIARQLPMTMFTATTPLTRGALFSAASGNYRLDTLISADLAGALAAQLLAGIISGSGTPPVQQGIVTDSNISTYSLGADGGHLDAVAAAGMERQLAVASNLDASPDQSSVAWFTTCVGRERMRLTPRFASGTTPLWTDEDTILSRKAFASTGLPSNLSKGTGTNLSLVLLALWSDYSICTWSPGLELVIDPFARKAEGVIEITARVMAVGAPLKYASILKAVDCDTSAP